jgi:hypothetical protein
MTSIVAEVSGLAQGEQAEEFTIIVFGGMRYI